jgi:malonyl CoA-acyl carrier protein transacylase/NAD(P)-dependent dehydrogenase (short-subunit alcohol dehydrogenase family)
VIREDDLVALSRARASCIFDATASSGDAGAMAAVSADAASVLAHLSQNPAVVIANENSPTQTVISGTTEGVLRVIETLTSAGIGATRIPVACAFHSPLVAGAQTPFSQHLDRLAIADPAVSVYSNTTAALYPTAPEAIRQRLVEHIASPVRFASEIDAMYEAGIRIFVEAGPGRVLTGLVARTLGDRPHLAVACDDPHGRGLQQLLLALAQLAVHGVELDIGPLFNGRGAQLFDLEAPPALDVPATAWWVNGHRAWPVQGDLPANALKPISGPVLSAPPNPTSPPSGNREALMHEYLGNVRQMFEATSNVMLTYLAETSLASSAVSHTLNHEQSAEPQQAIPAADVALPPLAPALVGVAGILVGSNGAAPLKMDDLESELIQIVSERTGYPIEMLGPDLDLEADLSIDSIKRVEILGVLTQRIGIRGDEALQELPEDLVRIKTIRGIVGALVAWSPSELQRPSLAPTPAPAGAGVAAPVLAPPAAPASVAPVTTETLEQLLVTLVSERTGYPSEMLGPDLDLEADLSIDSIKRVEILGAITQRLGIAADQAIGELPEDIVRIKTIRGIALALEQWAGGRPALPAISTGLPQLTAGSAAAVKTAHPIMRFIPSFAPTGRLGDSLASLTGSRVAATPKDSPLAAPIGDRLRAAGIGFQPERGSDLDVLVVLNALSEDWSRSDLGPIFETVRDALVASTRRVLVATRLGALSAGRIDPDLGLLGAGVGGMVRSLAKEWPDRVLQVLNFDSASDASFIVEQVCRELASSEGQLEVSYAGGVRRIMRPARVELSHAKPATDSIEEGSVILSLGGGRGITSMVLAELAQRSKLYFELVGRTRLVARESYAHLHDASDLVALRRRLAASGEFSDTASIEREARAIMANREIWTTIEHLNELGSEAEYHSLDVRDEEALARLIEDVYERRGRLDGVIHAAGVLEDRLSLDKTADSFERVFETKVAPAAVFSEKLPDGVKFVAFFSSVVGVFGNRGQADYATANDYLDKVALSLNGKSGTRYLSIDWGPWADSGMVSRDLLAEYERRGINLIAPELGVISFVDELLYGPRDNAQVILTAAEPSLLSAGGELH